MSGLQSVRVFLPLLAALTRATVSVTITWAKLFARNRQAASGGNSVPEQPPRNRKRDDPH